MAALTDIENRIHLDRVWKRDFDANRENAESVAQSIPILHVTSFESLLSVVLNQPLELVPSREGSEESARTVRAEDALGLERSLYFYSGRAFPGFGDVALAFEAGCEDDHTGSATPFDTGGLFAGHIKTNLPSNDPLVLRAFTQESLSDLGEWRDAFAVFLAAYFRKPADFWGARPCKADPDGVFKNPDNTWRAWTFEVRFYEGHNVCSRVAWAHSEAVVERLTEMLIDEPPQGAFPTPLQQFLEGKPSLSPQGNVDFCGEIERWTQREVGI